MNSGIGQKGGSTLCGPTRYFGVDARNYESWKGYGRFLCTFEKGTYINIDKVPRGPLVIWISLQLFHW